MSKQINNQKVEKYLDELSKKEVGNDVLDLAQKRVWGKLPQSIDSTQKPLTNESPWFSFLKLKPRYYYIFSASLALAILLVVSFNFISKNNNPKNTGSDIVAKVDNNNGGGTFKSEDIKLLAAKRLEQISGISYQDYQSLAKNQFQLAAPENSVGTVAGGSKPAIVNTIDSAKALDLINAKKVEDDKVFYSETEYTNYVDDNSNTNLEVDKPTLNQTWYSANYSKTITKQFGKITSFYLYSPEYNVEFLGGKYAIKETYAQKRYFNSLSLSDDTDNPELSFLKSILSDPNITRLGQKNVDGKNLEVIQTNSVMPVAVDTKVATTQISDSALNYTTRYYIDLNNFNLYLTENYQGDKLLNSQKNLKTETYLQPELNNYFNIKEIQNVEFKTTAGQEDYIKSSTLENFVSKYGVYYLPPLNQNFYVSDNNYYLELDSYKLRNTKDFNPNLNSTDSSPAFANSVGYYSNSNLNTEVYTTLPQNQTYQEGQFLIKNINILIEGKNVPATYYEIKNPSPKTPECISTTQAKNNSTLAPDCPVSSISPLVNSKFIIFKLNNYWYKVSESNAADSTAILSLPNLKFEAMTVAEAQKIDKYQQQKQDSYPSIVNVNLADIDSKIKLLPGDLVPKYQLSLASSVKSSKSGDKSTCIEFLASFSDIYNCLIEKYNGFGLYFYDSTNNSTGVSGASSGSVAGSSNGQTATPKLDYASKSLQLGVLDVNLSSLNLTKLTEQLKNLKITSGTDKITIQSDAESLKLILLRVKDKTVVLQLNVGANNQISEDQYISIVSEMDYDKGLAELTNQAQKNSGVVSSTTTSTKSL